MADEKLPLVMLLSGLSVNLNHIKCGIDKEKNKIETVSGLVSM